MNCDIEQIRLAYQQQMKQLQEKLEMSLQNLRISNSMITQQESSIQQLQSRITSLKKTKTDNIAFQKQASKINEKLEAIQHDTYQKMDTIHKYYKAINNSLKSIYEKENNALYGQTQISGIHCMQAESQYFWSRPFFTI
jgi:chromosome segregation ATPase